MTPEFRAVDLADREHRHGVQNVETLRNLITTCYFVAKWVPKILTDMDFAASAAGGVLGWLMLGGATVGILTHRFVPDAATMLFPFTTGQSGFDAMIEVEAIGAQAGRN